MNTAVSSKLMRRTALSLAAAALCAGSVSAANAATIWTERAMSGERVSLEAVQRGERYTRFIVHYVDAATYGSREHAAVERLATQRIEADLARVSKATSVDLALVRPTATGGFVFEVRNANGRAAAGIDAEKLMRELAKNPDVALVEPDLRMQIALTPNDTRYQDQWHYFQAAAGMNMPEAWDISTGSGIVVAVIDTGITSHSDLSGQTVAGYDFISTSSAARDGNGRDSNPADEGDWFGANECGVSYSANSSWHGTHVAGTIAATTNNSKGVAGVAFNAKIQPVRVLGKCGGSLSDIADGMIWASGGSVQGVPANQTPSKVLNLSLGGSGSCSSTYQSAINTARQRGSVVVIAAGNSNTNVSGFQPANCSGVVAVAASDREGNRASYSNYGNLIDVTAPGGETATSSNGVLSTLNSGTTTPGSESYAYYQGTSMATPHVAGLAALILAKASKTPDEIETLLKQNVRALPGSCSGGCGAGLVDARKTLLALGGGGGNVAPTANFTYNVSNLSVTFSDSSTDSDGSIASREWDFGDGTTSTQTSPSKTYAAAGTYTVKLKVVDNGGLDNTKTASVTVPGSGGDTVLQNGVAKSGLSAAAGGALDFTLVVPAGASGLKFVTSGGSGDVDVYAKLGSAPTTSSYDCKSDSPSNSETCTIATAQAGTYHVRLVAYAAFSGVSLTGSYTTGGGGGDFSNTTNYTIPDPGNVTSPITVSGQSGNASAQTKVTVNIVHPFRGDIQLDLIAPNGQTVRLKNWDYYDSADDIRATYTVNASATTKNGQWRLRASDVYANDAGYIDDWSIQF